MAHEMNENLNQQWFEFYIREFRKAPSEGFKKFESYFLCPCCRFPTLTERNGFEICPLCNWEDDGQDDHNADIVLGGPNHGYSLTAARQNFRSYLTSYAPSDTCHFNRTTVKKDINCNIILDLTALKRIIIEKFVAVISTDTIQERKQILNEIDTLFKKLSA